MSSISCPPTHLTAGIWFYRSKLLNFCKIDSSVISAIADQNGLKHNFYTPGTHIIIKYPNEALKMNPTCILLLAWNFTDEIISKLKEGDLTIGYQKITTAAFTKISSSF